MGHAFIKLAYNDVMTETLNKKAMETYGTFIADKTAPERVSVIILTWMISNRTTTTTPHEGRRSAAAWPEAWSGCWRRLTGIFRFGGEEFVVILPDIGEEEARRIAGALLTRCALRLFQEDLPDSAHCYGLFRCCVRDRPRAKDFSLIAKADRQLYICQNNGKNCVAASGAIYR